MEKKIMHHRASLPLVICALVLLSFRANGPDVGAFPYKVAGLTKRQAAAHLLSRFTYGAKPGQIDEVVKTGLENWFRQQLAADLPDADLNQMLSGYSTLAMTNEEIIRTFPKGGQVRRMAVRDGVIAKEDINKEQKGETRKLLADYMRDNGYRPQRELYRELVGQKILRATYSQNQLQEVLTGFWFNHFNVSLTDNDCARFILSYERDVIRPNALGNFETLLLATAKSPAMLTYLDNFRSGVPQQPPPRRPGKLQRRPAATDSTMEMASEKIRKQTGGVNENYAREVMELHTLGVDGGYTQTDVTEAARVFTGWTIFPGLNGNGKGRNINDVRFERNGFVRDGDFLFAANRHDPGEKMVLGTRFPADGGYDEGTRLINMLAQHPATAAFISRKLAIHFVQDSPPESLIKKMANTFSRTNGDIKEVLVTMVSAPEFWSKDAVREKIKSPFELAVSSVRALGIDVKDAGPLAGWIAKMGEQLYAYQAPTGFPDKGDYWINTGSLLSRMNFGLALASNRIKGLTMDVSHLNNGREPESAEQALMIACRYMMPERDLEETIKRLAPAMGSPSFSEKIDSVANTPTDATEEEMNGRRGGPPPDVIARAVGIAIGSPEFQRR
ncbi:MAG TPA: DUF1800 domain-containing protein [Chryseosolibacter sp.]|nr:DUF1800 domain-containing protein [Chryseosolibacter sp.]